MLPQTNSNWYLTENLELTEGIQYVLEQLKAQERSRISTEITTKTCACETAVLEY